MNNMDIFEYNQHFVAMMNIINAARLNPPERGHNHHIVPRCWFKLHNLPIDNSKDNLVLLTYEDHIKVHKLAMLCSATPEMRSKQAFAVKRLLKGHFTGLQHTEESRLKMSEHNCMHNESVRAKVRDWNLLHSPIRGKHQSAEANAKRSASHKGIKSSEATKRKIADHFKGKHRVKIDGKWRWV